MYAVLVAGQGAAGPLTIQYRTANGGVADAQVAWVVEVPRGTRRIRVTREEIRTRASRRGCPRPGLTDVGATQTRIRG